MTIQWPAILPQRPLSEGYSETWLDPVLRTPMDQGPDKVRLIENNPIRRAQLSFMMSAREYSWFREWWTDECKYGSVEFQWQHPDTLDVNTYRIVGPYTATATSGQRGLFYDVAMLWELLP